VSRHRRVLQNDIVAVFARHETPVREKQRSRGLRRDQASHETPSPTSCRRNLHVSSLPALSTAPLLDPLPYRRPTACCRKSSCVTGIAIFRDAASTFSTRLTRTPRFLSLPRFPRPPLSSVFLPGTSLLSDFQEC